jgi:hypothetical protein
LAVLESRRERLQRDAVYFDSSWARIEIGDAAEYGSCTRHEIQIATSRSDTEVTFVPRRGALGPGDYLVVVIDENDVVRAVEPIAL